MNSPQYDLFSCINFGVESRPNWCRICYNTTDVAVLLGESGYLGLECVKLAQHVGLFFVGPVYQRPHKSVEEDSIAV